jgi:hypothetical protein
MLFLCKPGLLCLNSCSFRCLSLLCFFQRLLPSLALLSRGLAGSLHHCIQPHTQQAKTELLLGGQAAAGAAGKTAESGK